MKLIQLFAWLVFGFFSIIGAHATVEPIVKLEFASEEVAVGEAVTLKVSVLVPTWFPKPPVFPSFELTNAITRLPDDSSYPTSERINGENWSGIIREYQLYPLIAATYQISDQSMQVTYTDPDTGKPVKFDQAIPSAMFKAIVPPGAEALRPYLGGRKLTLDRQINGDIESLKVGDALVVRYIAEIDGMPALFLPPMNAVIDQDGVSSYFDQPVVEDTTSGRREETVTLVFENGGEYSLPAIALDWWNIESAEIETVALPPLKITVTGPLPGPERQPIKPEYYGFYFAVLILLVLAATFIRRITVVVKAFLNKRKIEYHRSEGYAFKKLKSALHRKDAQATHQCILGWLEQLDPDIDTRDFALTYGNGLENHIDGLKSNLYSAQSTPIDWSQLEKQLVRARRRALRQKVDRSQTSLPGLNP